MRNESIKEKEKTILECFDTSYREYHYVNSKFHSCMKDSIDTPLQIILTTTDCFGLFEEKIILKYDGGDWKGILKIPKNQYSDDIKEIYPKCGWKNFENSLIEIDINSMIHNDNELDSILIENMVNDGTSLDIEIITSNKYEIFTYIQPDMLMKSFKQFKSPTSKKFGQFFNLIKDNFEFYYK
jgi:hypothetical protein